MLRPIKQRLTLRRILKADQALRVLDFQAHFHLFSAVVIVSRKRLDSEEFSSVASFTSAAAIVPSGKLFFTLNIKLKTMHKVNTCF